jgi:methionine-gamma-lyase
MKTQNKSTQAIHAGFLRDQYGSVTAPIYRASTFEVESIDDLTKRVERIISGMSGSGDGYFLYTRFGNPTNSILENRIASLESATDCVVTASGLGAISTAMWTFLKAGDHLLADTALYSDTHGLMLDILTRFGVTVDFIDFNKFDLLHNSLKPNTAMVYFESPCNPTLKINDIEKIADIAHKHNPEIKVVVDNTFATPYLQNPLKLGADIVVHSLTKYIGGHSDALGGAICTADKKDAIKIRLEGIEKCTGAVMSPDNAFLFLRGITTLPVRMMAHCANAAKIAEYLSTSKYVKVVHYPGLKSHPGCEIAKKQMSLFGGMISFELNFNFEETKKFVNSLKLIKLAVSLGGVESLLEHPASMTHAHFTPEELKAADITPSQVRISVGIEDVNDIIADLEQAFSSASNK